MKAMTKEELKAKLLAGSKAKKTSNKNKKETTKMDSTKSKATIVADQTTTAESMEMAMVTMTEMDEAMEAHNATVKATKKAKLPYKGSRWIKVHKQGEVNFVSKNNVMDITIGEKHSRAEITYVTSVVRNFKKAAYWLLRALKNACVVQIDETAANEIEAKANSANKETTEIEVKGESWSCKMQKLDKETFKIQVEWAETKAA